LLAELVDGLRRTPGGVLLEECGGLAHVALARSQEATQRLLPLLTRWRNESDTVLVELRGKRRNALRLLRTLAQRGRSQHAANLRVWRCQDPQVLRRPVSSRTILHRDANTARRFVRIFPLGEL
jgi:hypothetical protein